MISWLNLDGKLILTARGVRTFGYGFLSVVLPIYLKQIGFDSILIGVILTAILLSGAFFTIAGNLFADSIGRKKFLIFYAVLMALSGVIYASTTNTILLIVGALIGTLSPTGGKSVPSYLLNRQYFPNPVQTIREIQSLLITARSGK